MNRDFALGYLLGQSNLESEKPVPPQPSEIPEEWAPDYERPLPPPIRDDYDFVYILSNNIQFAEFLFRSLDCADVIIDWGDGTRDISIESSDGRYYFKNGNMLPFHIYNSPKSSVWIKVLIPKQSACSFNAVTFYVSEVIRNTPCFNGVYSGEGYDNLTICSDTCYCKDNIGYIHMVHAVNREIIFMPTNSISEYMEIHLSLTEIYVKIKGAIPTKEFTVLNAGSQLHSFIIEDASNITNMNGVKLLDLYGSMLKKVIVLKAVNVEMISEVIVSESKCIKKIQIISGESELEEDGIIVDCPKLKYVSNILKDSILSSINLSIRSECKTEINLYRLNYGIRNLKISVKSLSQPIMLSFESVTESSYRDSVESIVAEVGELPKNFSVWSYEFFSRSVLNNIFYKIKNFYPPYILSDDNVIPSYLIFKRALSNGMVIISSKLKKIGIKIGVGERCGSLSGSMGNTIEDANRIISLLPSVKDGIISVYINSNKVNPISVSPKLLEHLDRNLALSKGWKIKT